MAVRSYVVLVPKPGTMAGHLIDAGSGIVAARPVTERVEVYFEGNRFGADNLGRFAERVRCAAGRLAMRYPTIAREVLPLHEFVEVGTFTFNGDWSQMDLAITDQPTLDRWVGEAE